jgi:glycosyltransferase involved in cell wall biosynthesis
VIRQRNQGKSVALNRAITAAKGAYFAIQDGDDVSYPARIERLVDAMRDRPDLGAVFSRHDLIIDGRRVAPRSLPMSASACRVMIDAFRIPAHDPTGMYRIDVARAFSYDPEARIGQGVDMMLRVGEKHPIEVLGDCLYSYRVNADSATRAAPTGAGDAIERVRSKARARRGGPEPVDAFGSPPRATNSTDHHMVDAVVDRRLRSQWGAARRLALEIGIFRPRLIPRLAAMVLVPTTVLRRRRFPT